MTVTLRKLSHEEASRAFPRRGQTDVSEYAAVLRALQVGDSAELEHDGLSSRAAKRRLGLAATLVGFRLNWAPAQGDDRLYFQVLLATARPAGRAERGHRTRPPAGQPEAPIPVASNPPTVEMTVTSAPAPPRARRRRVVRPTSSK